jgi:hypothetical protein
MVAGTSFSLNIYRERPYHSIFGENADSSVANIYFFFAFGIDIRNSVGNVK